MTRRPRAGLTQEEAAHILGCSQSTVQRMVAAGVFGSAPVRGTRRLDLAEVEQAAAERWVRKPIAGRDPGSYLISSTEAGQLMGVSRARVGQLAARGRLPFIQAPGGIRLYRRAQVEAIANARISRRMK